MRKSNVSPRLQPSLLDKAKAVEEELSESQTDVFFRERAARADPAQTAAVLERSGRGKRPVVGDEMD